MCMSLDKAREQHVRNREKTSIMKFLSEPMFAGIPLYIIFSTVRRIERSILNAAIARSEEKCLSTSWCSDAFIERYSCVGFSVKINLDPNSSINIARDDPDVRFYTITRLFNAIVCRWLGDVGLGRLSHLLWDRIGTYMQQINPSSIGFMSPSELNPFVSKDYFDEIALRSAQKISKKFTTQYTCPQCFSKKAEHKEIQSARGDEGSTLFLNCLICGKKWRNYD